MLKRQIPNAITLLNLLCGIFAIICIFRSENLLYAPLFVLLGALFDFFDGMIARLLKVQSLMGKELDSLADVVTFGVVPSLMMYELLSRQFAMQGGIYQFLVYTPLLMAVFSCYRLAKFNIDERQTSSFIGLPTPANALFWLSIPVVGYLAEHPTKLWGWSSGSFYTYMAECLTHPGFILVGSIVMSFLLVSEIPLFSLKFKDFKWKNNRMRMIFLCCSLILLAIFNVVSLPFIVLLYILLSFIQNTQKK